MQGMKYLGMKCPDIYHFLQNGTSKYNISIAKNIDRENMEKIVRITEPILFFNFSVCLNFL